MRLWSIHPCYLDAKGLVALWREGLLAQKVLQGKTKGYKNHPQLIRFKKTKNPAGAVSQYLVHVFSEAERRGYSFDKTKISKPDSSAEISVTSGQIEYEAGHLKKKLKVRDRECLKIIESSARIRVHPIFRKKKGGIEEWEITE